LELDNALSKEEEEKISKELRKLGYIWGSNVVTIQCNYYHDWWWKIW
jgi:hypothetical protein